MTENRPEALIYIGWMGALSLFQGISFSLMNSCYYDIFVYKYIVERDPDLGKLRIEGRVQPLFSIVFFNTYVKNASMVRQMLSPGGSWA